MDAFKKIISNINNKDNLIELIDEAIDELITPAFNPMSGWDEFWTTGCVEGEILIFPIAVLNFSRSSLKNPSFGKVEKLSSVFFWLFSLFSFVFYC